MVILLNILNALYNSAYASVSDHGTEEFVTVYATKTIQFIRAPDEKVFIAPFNLIEVLFLVMTCELWLVKKKYQR